MPGVLVHELREQIRVQSVWDTKWQVSIDGNNGCFQSSGASINNSVVQAR